MKLFATASIAALAILASAQNTKPISTNLPEPDWMKGLGADHLFYKRAPYNWAILKVPNFAKDMFATSVGHAIAYEALVTGRQNELEGSIYNNIYAALKNPPRNPVDENTISPHFHRKYGALNKVFDWAHTLHFQTIDILIHPGWTDAQKEAEIERIWAYYSSEPYAITGLPLNMEYLDGFSYSGKFRKAYPKTNGLFWGYHWLQSVNYDMLYKIPLKDQLAQYNVIGEWYHESELLKTDRDFMPMVGELSPRFAKRFPYIANSFDNLHMLHDNVNDILTDSSLTEAQKQYEVNQAIIRVLASTHAGESAVSSADDKSDKQGTLHDHRYPFGMPGMGMMKGATEFEMYMTGMGWMNMSECSHCSIPLNDEPDWGASVSANGWTMLVRCIMCARDMAAEIPGKAIIRSATEDPNRILVLISDEEGNWTSNIPGVVFLEKFGEHYTCNSWSKAFTSREACEKAIRENDEFAGMKPMELAEWSAIHHGKPNTYRKINKPNPYRSQGGSK